MPKKKPPPKVPVVNPRYQGATPEQVGRALLTRQPKPEIKLSRGAPPKPKRP